LQTAQEQDWSLKTSFAILPPDKPNLPREGDQTIEFQFLSTLPWDVTCDKPWCIPGKVSGAASDAILVNKLYIQENSGGTRTAVVSLVNSANEKLSFPITQAGNMAFLHGTQGRDAPCQRQYYKNRINDHGPRR
jgi:hypothetical protein